MALTGVTETNVTAVDVVSQLVQLELRARAILVPSLTDYSSLIVPGANKISIPRFASLTAEDKAENTALTAQAFTASQDEIDLNKHKASLVNLERIAKTQSALNMDMEVMKFIASSIVDSLEAEANTVLQAASASAPDHRVEYATTNVLAKADILEARRLLATQNVPMNDGRLFMAIHPNQEEDILNESGFIDASQYGSANPIQNGEIGRIYGFRVLVSTNVTADTSLFYHQSHCAFGLQEQVQFDTVFDADNLSDKIVGWALAGFQTMDGGKRGVRKENAV